MNPLVGVTRPRVRGVEHPVRDAHRQGAEGLLARSRGWPSRGRARTTARRGPTSCAPNLKWSDGQPLTAEDVAYTINRARRRSGSTTPPSSANLTAKAHRRPHTVVVTSSVADPKLPTMDIYILPKHIWEKQDAKAITKYHGAGRRRLGPVHARAAREGPVRALQGQPELLRRQAGGRPRRAAQLQQPRRDGRRAQARRDRRRRGRPRHRRSTSSRRTRTSSRSRATRARSTSSRSTAAPA